MVSPFTLGLFAPLPLAMMIPFMATQSLAMGEAFGKSFQYGKRKISSMTNEEFNKLTFQNLMDEQTANVKSIIPKLHEQMADSKAMQEDIFREMTNLIPAFLKGLGAGVEDVSKTLNEDFQDFLKNPTRAFQTDASHETTQANTQQSTTIVNVSHDGESTLETPTPSHTTSTSDLTQDNRIAFRNKIKNYNIYSLNQLLKTPLEQWQRKMIEERAMAIRKFETPSIPIPEQTPLTSQQSAQKAYLTKTIDFQKQIIVHNNKRYALSLRSQYSPSLASQEVTQQNKMKVIQKKLKNFITLSRNNRELKSVANRDWNDRIWNINAPGKLAI